MRVLQWLWFAVLLSVAAQVVRSDEASPPFGIPAPTTPDPDDSRWTDLCKQADVGSNNYTAPADGVVDFYFCNTILSTDGAVLSLNFTSVCGNITIRNAVLDAAFINITLFADDSEAQSAASGACDDVTEETRLHPSVYFTNVTFRGLTTLSMVNTQVYFYECVMYDARGVAAKTNTETLKGSELPHLLTVTRAASPLLNTILGGVHVVASVLNHSCDASCYLVYIVPSDNNIISTRLMIWNSTILLHVVGNSPLVSAVTEFGVLFYTAPASAYFNATVEVSKSSVNITKPRSGVAMAAGASVIHFSGGSSNQWYTDIFFRKNTVVVSWDLTDFIWTHFVATQTLPVPLAPLYLRKPCSLHFTAEGNNITMNVSRTAQYAGLLYFDSANAPTFDTYDIFVSRNRVHVTHTSMASAMDLDERTPYPNTALVSITTARANEMLLRVNTFLLTIYSNVASHDLAVDINEEGRAVHIIFVMPFLAVEWSNVTVSENQLVTSFGGQPRGASLRRPVYAHSIVVLVQPYDAVPLYATIVSITISNNNISIDHLVPSCGVFIAGLNATFKAGLGPSVAFPAVWAASNMLMYPPVIGNTSIRIFSNTIAIFRSSSDVLGAIDLRAEVLGGIAVFGIAAPAADSIPLFSVAIAHNSVSVSMGQHLFNVQFGGIVLFSTNDDNLSGLVTQLEVHSNHVSVVSGGDWGRLYGVAITGTLRIQSETPVAARFPLFEHAFSAAVVNNTITLHMNVTETSQMINYTNAESNASVVGVHAGRILRPVPSVVTPLSQFPRFVVSNNTICVGAALGDISSPLAALRLSGVHIRSLRMRPGDVVDLSWNNITHAEGSFLSFHGILVIYFIIYEGPVILYETNTPLICSNNNVQAVKESVVHTYSGVWAAIQFPPITFPRVLIDAGLGSFDVVVRDNNITASITSPIILQLEGQHGSTRLPFRFKDCAIRSVRSRPGFRHPFILAAYSGKSLRIEDYLEASGPPYLHYSEASPAIQRASEAHRWQTLSHSSGDVPLFETIVLAVAGANLTANPRVDVEIVCPTFPGIKNSRALSMVGVAIDSAVPLSNAVMPSTPFSTTSNGTNASLHGNVIHLDLMATFSENSTGSPVPLVNSMFSNAVDAVITAVGNVLNATGNYVACSSFRVFNSRHVFISGGAATVASGSLMASGGTELRDPDRNSDPMVQWIAVEKLTHSFTAVNISVSLDAFYGGAGLGVNLEVRPAVWVTLRNVSIRLAVWGSNAVAVLARTDDSEVARAAALTSHVHIYNVTVELHAVDVPAGRLVSAVLVGSLAGSYSDKQIAVAVGSASLAVVVEGAAGAPLNAAVFRVVSCSLDIAATTLQHNNFSLAVVGDVVVPNGGFFGIEMASLKVAGPSSAMWANNNIVITVSQQPQNITASAFTFGPATIAGTLVLGLADSVWTVRGATICSSAHSEDVGSASGFHVNLLRGSCSVTMERIEAEVESWCAIGASAILLEGLNSLIVFSLTHVNASCTRCGAEAAALAIRKSTVGQASVVNSRIMTTWSFSSHVDGGAAVGRVDALVVMDCTVTRLQVLQTELRVNSAVASEDGRSSSAFRAAKTVFTVGAVFLRSHFFVTAGHAAAAILLVGVAGAPTFTSCHVEVESAQSSVSTLYDVYGVAVISSPDLVSVKLDMMTLLHVACTSIRVCNCAPVAVIDTLKPDKKVITLTNFVASYDTSVQYTPVPFNISSEAQDVTDTRQCVAAALLLDAVENTTVTLGTMQLSSLKGAGVYIRNSMNVSVDASGGEYTVAVAAVHLNNCSGENTVLLGVRLLVLLVPSAWVYQQALIRAANATVAVVSVATVDVDLSSAISFIANFSLVLLDARSVCVRQSGGDPPTMSIKSVLVQMFDRLVWFSALDFQVLRSPLPYASGASVSALVNVTLEHIEFSGGLPASAGQLVAPGDARNVTNPQNVVVASHVYMKCVVWDDVLIGPEEATALCSIENISMSNDTSSCPTASFAPSTTAPSTTTAATATMVPRSTHLETTGASSSPAESTVAPLSAPPATEEPCGALPVQRTASISAGGAAVNPGIMTSLRNVSASNASTLVVVEGDTVDKGNRFLWVRVTLGGPTVTPPRPFSDMSMESFLQMVCNRTMDWWSVAPLVLWSATPDADGSGAHVVLCLEVPASKFPLVIDAVAHVALKAAQCTSYGDMASFSVVVRSKSVIFSPPVVTAVTTSVGASVIATTIVAGSSIAVSSSVATAKLKGIIALSGCAFDHTVPLDFITSPSQLCFGVEQGRCYRGGVVGSIAVLAGVCCCILLFGVAWSHQGAKARSSPAPASLLVSNALQLIHAPSVFLIPFAVLGEGLAVTSTATLVHAASAADYVVGLAGYFVCLAAVGYAWYVVKTFSCVLVRREGDVCAGLSAIEAVLKSDMKWAARPGTNALFKARHIHLFNDYRVYFYPTVELTLTCVFGVFEGLRLDDNEVGCLTASLAVAVLSVGLGGFIAWARPPLVTFEAAFLYIGNGFGVLAAVLMLAGNVTGHDGVQDAAEITAMVGVAVNLLKLGLALVFGIAWLRLHLHAVPQSMLRRASLMFLNPAPRSLGELAKPLVDCETSDDELQLADLPRFGSTANALRSSFSSDDSAVSSADMPPQELKKELSSRLMPPHRASLAPQPRATDAPDVGPASAPSPDASSRLGRKNTIASPAPSDWSSSFANTHIEHSLIFDILHKKAQVAAASADDLDVDLQAVLHSLDLNVLHSTAP